MTYRCYYCRSFRRYHMEHHTYQGEDRVDTDVPTAFEVAFFNNTAKKLLWVVLQPAFYALRPLLTNPKAPTRWEAINFSCQIAFDFAIYHFFGGKALAYLIFGTLLGMGLHPMAGHFIAEHYTFIKGQVWRRGPVRGRFLDLMWPVSCCRRPIPTMAPSTGSPTTWATTMSTMISLLFQALAFPWSATLPLSTMILSPTTPLGSR